MKKVYLCIMVMVALALFAIAQGDKTYAQSPTGEDIPFLEEWENSPHNDAEAEAFTHWNEDGEIREACAKCHSTPGFLDYIGEDGSEAGTVDQPAPLGTTVTCKACHNNTTKSMTSVTFPSGEEVLGLGDESRCMQCHQGRASTLAVDESIAEAGLTDDDTPSEDLGFTNIHYKFAAATQAGTTAMGGYEYEGKSYDAKFAHVEGLNACIDCHDSHTLEVKVDGCADCHEGAETEEDLVDIRMEGSNRDYDGDGDMDEGVYYEIEGLREKLAEAIQAYATEVAGQDIAYTDESHPYFFNDNNANGEADEDEANDENAYSAWTGRLAKAAYNYQFSLKDHGAYAHGGKYVIELLYDSIENLNEQIETPIDLEGAHRVDAGHFNGADEPFRHWDADEETNFKVPGTCSKCHSAEGLPLFLQDNAAITQEPSNGLMCSTCHTSLKLEDMNEDDALPIHELAEGATVTFPSGNEIVSESASTNLCINCHQGRASKNSVDKATADMDADEVSEDLGFINIHYYAAGATRYGTEAQGAYEYEGKEYSGFYEHAADSRECTDCHSTHGLTVKVDSCGGSGCHSGVETMEDVEAIRGGPIRGDLTDDSAMTSAAPVDYDGDGDLQESLRDEIAGVHEALYVAIQSYASETAGADIAYESHTYPYFFLDTNGDGMADEEEAVYPNQFNAWTPRLLKAAYNYQYVAKDPGAFTHNPSYVLQAMYDSLEDLGSADGLTRAEVVTAE